MQSKVLLNSNNNGTGTQLRRTEKDTLAQFFGNSFLLFPKPFLIIYDEQKNPVVSDGVLDGKIPVIPSGALDYARTHSENVISWMPRKDVRSALVIIHVHGSFSGFVVAGRSLRMVEERESSLTKQIAFGWLFSLGILLVIVFLLRIILK